MNRLIFIFAFIVLVVVFSLSSSSLFLTNEQNDNEVTLTFKDDSNFTLYEKSIIENSFSNKSVEAQSFNLLCSLFGHDYKAENLNVIRHKVNLYAPRCIEEYYIIKICSRCSDTQKTLIRSAPINCCP